MAPKFPGNNPNNKLALFPLFLGLGLIPLGILMIARPLLLLQILVVLLGIPVLVGGLLLVLFGLDLMRKFPRVAKDVKVGKWRFFSDKDRW